LKDAKAQKAVKSYMPKAQKLPDAMSHMAKSAKDAKAKGWSSEDGSGPVGPAFGGKSSKGMSHGTKSSKKLFHKSEKAEPQAPAATDDEVSRDVSMRI